MNKIVQQKFCADPECETPGAHIHPIKNVVDLDNALEVEEIMEYKSTARRLFEEEIKKSAADIGLPKERYPSFSSIDCHGSTLEPLDVQARIEVNNSWGKLRHGLSLPKRGFTVNEILAADRETLLLMLRGAGRYKTLVVDTDY